MKQNVCLASLIILFLFFQIIYTNSKTVKSTKAAKTKNTKIENKIKKTENNNKKQFFTSRTSYCKFSIIDN